MDRNNNCIQRFYRLKIEVGLTGLLMYRICTHAPRPFLVAVRACGGVLSRNLIDSTTNQHNFTIKMADDLFKPTEFVCDDEFEGLFRDRMHMVKNKNEIKFHLSASLSEADEPDSLCSMFVEV